jgi:hypothetical protein
VGNPNPGTEGAGKRSGGVPDVAVVRRYFDLDSSPRHTVEPYGHNESAWLHKRIRDVDGPDFAAHETLRMQE